ncbi:MAG TPA: iron ABC transporter permease [Verrucomicrobiae bacterium]|jgi:iron(III) transport system permease protein|nr:iron ABC transporter permease [Verrucomicrobiae bacterium]
MNGAESANHADLLPRAASLRFDVRILLLSLLLAGIAFLVITPLFLLLLNSFQIGKPGGAIVYGLDGWRQAFSSAGILDAIYNSFSLAITRQAIGTVVGIFLAWLLARTDIPMKHGLEFMFWLSFFLPALPVTLGWILLLDPKYGILNQLFAKLPFIGGAPFDIYSYWGIVWVHLATTGISLKVMLLTPAFRNLDASLEESSRVAGAGTLRTMMRIIVPVMMPVILVTTILGLIRSLEAFEIELVLGVPIGLHVFSTKIHSFVTHEPPQFPPATALGAFFLLLLLALVAFQRLYLGRRSYVTVTGRSFSTRPIALGRWKYPALILVLGLSLSLTVLPIAFLLLGTFMKLFGFFTIKDPFTLDNWRGVLSDPILLRSIKNTLVLGFCAAGIGVIVSSLVAYVIVKSRFKARMLLDFLCWLPWAIPGILLGMALLWTLLLIHKILPIYGTMGALVLAMAISGLPVCVQVMKSFLMQLSNELEEASMVAGASWLTTYRRIVLPLILPCLIVVGLLEFISAARNISTVVLLATGQTRPLSLLMLDYAAGAELERATVVATVIVGIVVLAALGARSLGGQFSIRG